MAGKFTTRLSAKQKRTLYIAIGAVVVVGAAMVLSHGGSLHQSAPPVNANNLLGNANAQNLGLSSLNTAVKSLQDQNANLKQQMSQMQEQNSKLSAQARGGAGSPAGASSSAQASYTPYPTPGVAQPTPTIPITPYTNSGTSPNGGAANGTGNGNGNDQVPSAPEITTVGGAAPASASTTATDSKKDGHEVFIPAGTMLTGVLLTGLDAPTGREAKSQPIPVLVRVKEDAVLPNEYKADYRECFIVADGYGDLSSERAYLRGESLSCVRKDGGVIEAHIQMWGTGEDGKAGMRGTLVSKQGSVIARALLAGFASGLSNAFTPMQQLAITGTGSTYQSIPMGTAGRMALGGGIGGAANEVAQYYLKLAESEFPVIEVSAGRPVTFIVEKGVKLQTLQQEQEK